jgi:hypothetical protein
LVYGIARDRFGGYDEVLGVAALAYGLGAALLLGLGPYPKRPGEDS